MKTALRTIIFSYIAVYIAQIMTLAIDITNNSNDNYHLFILGLSAIYFFSKPLLRILSLPHKGIGNLFLNFILTTCFVYILMTFVPLISISEATIPDLKLFGFVLPSKELKGITGVVFTSLLIAVVYSFFEWLSTSNK